MKLFLATILFTCIAVFGSSQSIIPSGTFVSVKSVERLVTDKTHDVGDAVSFIVAEDVIKDGVVMVKAGQPVIATIKQYRRPRGCGIPGRMLISINYIKLSNGNDVPLNAELLRRGKSKTGLAAGLAGGLTVGLLCPPFLALLAIKGKPAILEAGYTVTCTTTADTKF